VQLQLQYRTSDRGSALDIGLETSNEPLRIVVVYLQKRGFEKNAIEILARLQLIASFQQIATQKRRIPIVSNHA